MKKTLSILLLLFLLHPVMAKEIYFNTIQFEIEDNFQTKVPTEEASFNAEKDSAYLIIKKHNFPNKAIYSILKRVDTIQYPILRDLALIQVKSEPLFLFSKDYYIKEYQGKNGEKYMTYSSYTSNHKIYAALACYHNEVDRKSILKTYRSITANIRPFKKLMLSYMNAPTYWIIYMMIFFLLGVFSKGDKNAINKKLLLSCILLSLPFLWVASGGFWVTFGVSLLFETMFFSIGAVVSP